MLTGRYLIIFNNEFRVNILLLESENTSPFLGFQSKHSFELKNLGEVNVYHK